MTHQATQPVGFIGLGRMGSRLAVNLCRSGHRVLVFDAIPSQCDTARDAGAQVMADIRELLKSCTVILTCLPDIDAFWSTIDAIAANALPNSCLIETSTLPLKERHKARERLAVHGVAMLDCPLVGSAPMAENRQVSVYASGNTATFEAHRWVLDGLSDKVVYAGEFGNGTSLKLVANMLLSLHNAAAAEAMVFGQKAGLDPALIYRVISGSAASSGMFEVRGALMARGNYNNGMSYAIALKDSRILRTVADDLQCPTPFYSLATQAYYAAAAQGWLAYDTASICAVMERNVGITRSRPETQD